MLLTLFSPFYEWICGSNNDSPEYNDNGIYDSVGFITVVLTLIVTVIFFVLLGRWKPVFYTIRAWIITLIINVFMGFGLAFTTAKEELGLIDGYLIRFAIINAAFTIVLFFILSVVLKRASIFAKRTPF